MTISDTSYSVWTCLNNIQLTFLFPTFTVCALIALLLLVLQSVSMIKLNGFGGFLNYLYQSVLLTNCMILFGFLVAFTFFSILYVASFIGMTWMLPHHHRENGFIVFCILVLIYILYYISYFLVPKYCTEENTV